MYIPWGRTNARMFSWNNYQIRENCANGNRKTRVFYYVFVWNADFCILDMNICTCPVAHTLYHPPPPPSTLFITNFWNTPVFFIRITPGVFPLDAAETLEMGGGGSRRYLCKQWRTLEKNQYENYRDKQISWYCVDF